MILSEEQTLIRDTARAFAQEQVLPHVRAWEAAGEIPRSPLNLALLKGCAIVGVACIEPAGSPVNFRQLIAWVADGTLKLPPIERHSLEAAARAHERLESRKTTGALVLVA